MTIQRLFAIALLIGVSTAYAQDEASTEKEQMHAEHEFHRGEMKAKMKMHHKQRVKDHLSSLDKNDDGKVDLQEYLSSAEERFNKMDVNGDNFVTSDEAREAHQHMREKHRSERKKRQEKRQEKRNKIEKELNNDSD